MSRLEEELKNAVDTSKTKVKWAEDPQGYFTIKPFFDKRKVYVRYYKGNQLTLTLAGVKTEQVIQEIVDRGLISRMEHAAYLGREIEKALIALKNELCYVQDKALILRGKERDK